MIEVEEQTMFSFSELNDAAKTAARNEYRDSEYILDYSWWGHVYEDAIRLGALLGINIMADDIHFSGFASQGDGASFAGTYISDRADLNKLKAEAPKDTVLHSLADQLALLQVTQRLATGRARIEFRIYTVGRDSHSGTMRVEDIYDLVPDDDFDNSDELCVIVRRFADWIYAQLEQEHDYLISDESIDQYLNDLTFDSSGSEV